MPDQTYLVATDMSPRSDRALRRAFHLARQQQARLIVLSVVDDATPADIADTLRKATHKKLTEFTTSIGDAVNYDLRVQYGDPTAEILAMAEAEAANLLIMGTHRVRPFMDALRETTVQRIARLTACPVLVVTDRSTADYETIVAATDFSPGSAAAIALANRIAPQASITPVHALHVPYKGMLARTPDVAQDLEATFHNEALQDDSAWRETWPVPATVLPTQIVEGGPMGALIDQVRSSAAQLISVGAHGRVGQHRALLGSVATELMRDPPCDVLIARPG